MLLDMHQQAADAVAREQAVPAGVLRMMRQGYAFVWRREGSNKCQMNARKTSAFYFDFSGFAPIQ